MNTKSGTCSRTRPIAFGQNSGGRRPPGSLKHVGQQQHRHIAPHAVALAGYLEQLADHRLLRRGIGVIEL